MTYTPPQSYEELARLAKKVLSFNLRMTSMTDIYQLDSVQGDMRTLFEIAKYYLQRNPDDALAQQLVNRIGRDLSAIETVPVPHDLASTFGIATSEEAYALQQALARHGVAAEIRPEIHRGGFFGNIHTVTGYSVGRPTVSYPAGPFFPPQKRRIR